MPIDEALKARVTRIYFDHDAPHNGRSVGQIDGPEATFGDYFCSGYFLLPEGQTKDTFRTIGMTYAELRAAGVRFIEDDPATLRAAGYGWLLGEPS